MSKHGTNPVEKASTQQVLDLQHEFGRVFQNIPSELAKKILSNKTQTRKFVAEICKKLNIPNQPENILTVIPLLEKYYSDVYGIIVDLSEMIFYENRPAYMAVHPDLDEDTIMNAIQTYFNKKKENSISLYKYRDPVAKNIDRNEELKISPRPSGLYVFGHTGEDEPDAKHRNKSYNDAIAEGLTFANAKEYLLMTGFHKYTKGYFMDKKGWTRTSSLWVDGFLVLGNWDGDGSGLRLYYGRVDFRDPDDGPRELFLSA